MVQISKGCLNEGIRRGSGVERLSSGSESHTNVVRVRASPALIKIFSVCRCVNLPICMWSGCRRADPVVSQAYPGMPRYVLAEHGQGTSGRSPFFLYKHETSWKVFAFLQRVIY